MFPNRASTFMCRLLTVATLFVATGLGCDKQMPNACPVDYNQNGHLSIDEGLRFVSDQVAQQKLAVDTPAQNACMELSTDIDGFIGR